MIIRQSKDIEGNIIQGSISPLPFIENFAIEADSWTPIEMNHDSTQIVLQCRDVIEWEFCTISGGNYFTMKPGGALCTNIVAPSGTIIGWVRTQEATTMELLVGF